MIDRVPLSARVRQDAQRLLRSGRVVYTRTDKQLRAARAAGTPDLVDCLCERYRMTRGAIRHLLFVAQFTVPEAYHWLKSCRGVKLRAFPVQYRPSKRRKRRKLMGSLSRGAFGSHAY